MIKVALILAAISAPALTACRPHTEQIVLACRHGAEVRSIDGRLTYIDGAEAIPLAPGVKPQEVCR